MSNVDITEELARRGILESLRLQQFQDPAGQNALLSELQRARQTLDQGTVTQGSWFDFNPLAKSVVDKEQIKTIKRK